LTVATETAAAAGIEAAIAGRTRGPGHLRPGAAVKAVLSGLLRSGRRARRLLRLLRLFLGGALAAA
jgi:hypothetical protein